MRRALPAYVPDPWMKDPGAARAVCSSVLYSSASVSIQQHASRNRAGRREKAEQTRMLLAPHLQAWLCSPLS